jgi:hypothetical protein
MIGLALRQFSLDGGPSASPQYDLTPYVMARRVRLPGGEAWRERLRSWLLAQQAGRALLRDEEDLLLFAGGGDAGR